MDLPREAATLATLSPHFKEEALGIIETMPAGESVLVAFNITQPSHRPPFRFGFVLFTTERLIRVLYGQGAEMLMGTVAAAFGVKMEPKRPFVEAWTESGPRARFLAVRSPTYPLREGEIASRELVSVP